MTANNVVQDLRERLRQLEGTVDNLLRRRSGAQPNMRDLRDADLSKVANGQAPVYASSTGKWAPGSPVDTSALHKALTETATGDKTFSGLARHTGPVSETVTGATRVDLGVSGTTPRILFERATGGVWEIDFDGTFLQFFRPGAGGLKLKLDASGNLTATNNVNAVGFEGEAFVATGAASAIYFQNRSGANYWRWYATSDVARLNNASGDLVTVTAGGILSATVVRGLAYNSGVQSIVQLGERLVVLNNASTGGGVQQGVSFDSTNSELTIVTAGDYDLAGRIKANFANLTNNFTLHLIKNRRGTPVTLDDDHGIINPNGFPAEHTLKVGTTEYLAAGDTVSMIVEQDSTAAQPTLAGRHAVWLSAKRIGS